MIPKTMKAVILTAPTPAEQVRLCEVPVPAVRPGWVLVKVKAFGMNHSEQILRLSEIQANYIQKPIIPGIECVGEIADPSDSQFATGQKVAALMGGMGRSFSGSYAEYALLPAHHVFAVSSDLSWAQLAAVPETYFTAWGSLFASLHLKSEDTLLVRGGTCALGYAAIQLAKALGCRVIATTHRSEKLPLLAAADAAILDTGILEDSIIRRDKGPGAGWPQDPQRYPALCRQRWYCLQYRYFGRCVHSERLRSDQGHPQRCVFDGLFQQRADPAGDRRNVCIFGGTSAATRHWRVLFLL